MMLINSKITAAVCACLVSLMSSGYTYATSCDQVELGNSNCAEGVYYNDTKSVGGTLQHSARVYIRHLCPELKKKISIRVYFQNNTTQQLVATEDSTRSSKTYKGRGKSTGLRCCSNLGMCNKSDVINDEGCKAQYETSAASNSCTNATVTFWSGTSCKINNQCKQDDGTWSRYQNAYIEYLEVPDLRNCDGYMTTNTNCYRGSTGF